jgi:glycosyltransferase involved in cell wall biosynthesis
MNKSQKLSNHSILITQPERILFVDHAPALGGAEQNLLVRMQYLNRERWQPHLACVPGALANRAVMLGVPCHLVSLPPLRRSHRFWLDWYKNAQAIATLADELDAAILYANTVRAAMYVALAARLARRPFLWHMQDFWLSEAKPRRLWADNLLKKVLCQSAKQVIANSYAVAQTLPCSVKTAVRYYGIELDHFDPSLDGRPFREQYHIPFDVPLVGMVGRLRPWKGQTHFLHMAAQVKQQRPEARFVIVGGANFDIENDAYPQQLEALAHELGIAEQVIFTGMLEDVRPSLAAMDIFVHPGEPEPFGLVNVEAMAMAKPVVAFGHGALPEIVEDGKTGLLVSPGDIPALATAIISLLDNEERRQFLGHNGRTRAETHFTIQRAIQEFEEIFRGMRNEK